MPLSIAIAIAIVLKKAIAIVFSILLANSGTIVQHYNVGCIKKT